MSFLYFPDYIGIGDCSYSNAFCLCRMSSRFGEIILWFSKFVQPAIPAVSKVMKPEKNEKQTVREFIDILRSIRDVRDMRRQSLERMFWEYNNCNVDLFEDRESKIQKYLPEKLVYPKAFLASNLGFNRSTMDSKYMEILSRFKLGKKSTSGSIRNAVHFETLKHLIMKYFDKIKNK